MKRIHCPIVILLLITSVYLPLHAQVYEDVYELQKDFFKKLDKQNEKILGSFLDLEANLSSSNAPDDRIRFSMPNIIFPYHFSFGKNRPLNFRTALGLTNIGFVQNSQDTIIKRRTFNLNGQLKSLIQIRRITKRPIRIYIGPEIDFPIHFKQKTLFNGELLEKRTLGARNNELIGILPSLALEVRPSITTGLKFKYQLTNLLNQDFETEINNRTITPYKFINSKILTVSLVFSIGKIAG